MSLSVRANKVTFKADALDIYVSEELKIALEKIHSKKPEKIVFDMKKVERISTPVLQLFISAKKSFDEFTLINMSPQLEKDIVNMGVQLNA
ncbi:MAG: STAS domain-containing protein [Thermodesulfovibrionia bacterium]|nr:STAS domain-containing protein [Thermodesulfovibrionia bacterium]